AADFYYALPLDGFPGGECGGAVRGETRHNRTDSPGAQGVAACEPAGARWRRRSARPLRRRLAAASCAPEIFRASTTRTTMTTREKRLTPAERRRRRRRRMTLALGYILVAFGV